MDNKARCRFSHRVVEFANHPRVVAPCHASHAKLPVIFHLVTKKAT
jgi:hypothetical protein